MTDFVTRWTTALRGGDYKQGSLRLRSSQDTFCCLGVACDLVDPSLWERGVRKSDYTYEGAPVIPPDRVLEMAGISWHQARDLVCMNDMGHSFSEIADWIDANVTQPPAPIP